MVAALYLSLFLGNPYVSDSLSFKKDIKPIFKNNCVSCHNAKSGLPNILEYNVAFKKSSEIKEAMQSMEMPHKANTLTHSERDKIILWVDQGSKE